MDDDPSSGVAHASDGRFDGTCTACPIAVPGHHGGAYQFTGAQWIALPAIADGLLGSQPYTVTVWIDADPEVKEETITEKSYNAVGELNIFKLFLNTGTVVTYETAMSAPSGFDIFDPSSTSVASAWHHIAARWDGAVKTVFIDGIAVGHETPSAVIDTSAPVQIGADLDGGIQDNFFTGLIDDLRFYDSALTDAEIVALAAQ